MREPRQFRDEDVVLGDDWLLDNEGSTARRSRGFITFNSSPLARKIITFNILGLVVLVGGVLFLNPFRDSLTYQFQNRMVSEATLIARIFESHPSAMADPNVILRELNIDPNARIQVFDNAGILLAKSTGDDRPAQTPIPELVREEGQPLITAFLEWFWSSMSSIASLGRSPSPDGGQIDLSPIDKLVRETSSPHASDLRTSDGDPVFAVGVPIVVNGVRMGSVAVASAAGEVDSLLSNEREQVLQMFVIAILVSIGLSLVLSSTIANPLADLATAAEAGSETNNRKMTPERVRIPDLTGRPDEIGRLSAAIRKMVTALYERIDANEQFAADVAHEIKNPLASLRSAVGTMRVAKRDDQRERLLEVIEHDVRRLDRLVSDISNASRLDSELVKEDEAPFDLLIMLGNINEFLGQQAREKGIDYIADVPPEPITISGLRERLAQVFVNIITNAISFCGDGDAIRLWVRRRENRVLVVVEDTGPGIPEAALTKIFNRFYSERPEGQFGNNSGLGLAISKQIVEAHGGVIWAENIRPTDAGEDSSPLGARFVVGLPV